MSKIIILCFMIEVILNRFLLITEKLSPTCQPWRSYILRKIKKSTSFIIFTSMRKWPKTGFNGILCFLIEDILTYSLLSRGKIGKHSKYKQSIICKISIYTILNYRIHDFEHLYNRSNGAFGNILYFKYIFYLQLQGSI